MVARSKARKNAPAMTPPRAVAPSRTSQDRMILWAMLASLLIHGVLLSIHFRLPEKLARQKDRGLEVILVNARHARAPEKPEALAQANLDGGGNTDKNIRAKTPLPAQDRRREGDALLEAQRRVQQLEAAQREMLTRIKSKLPVAVDEQKQEQEPPRRPRPSPASTCSTALRRSRGWRRRSTRTWSSTPSGRGASSSAPAPASTALRNMSRTGARRSNALARSTTPRPRAAGSMAACCCRW